MDRPDERPEDRRPAPQGDASRVRISDAERERVAEVLRDAAAEGRLEMDELDERLGAAYGARVAADLVPLLADLPAGLEQAAPATPARPVPGGESGGGLARQDVSLAIMGGKDRRGPWEIGETHTALAVMGGVDLDLREVRLTARETVITAVALMGGVDVIVGPDVRVVVDGVGIMGGFDEVRPTVDPELRPDSPVVRVRGLALMGAVEVHRKGPPRRSLR